jgi:hypothetical protein
LLLALFAVFALVPTLRADDTKEILKLVPDDAWGFIVLKSCDNLDEKAALVKEVLALQFPTPVTPMALMMLNVGDKVDMTMPVCAVLMDVKKYGVSNPGEAAVLLVPAKDPQVLLEALTPKEGGDAKADKKEKAGDPAKQGEDQPPKGKKPSEGKKTGEGKKAAEEKELPEGLTKIALMNQPAYAATKGKYLIVGSNQECVTKVAKTKKALAEGLAEARAAVIDKSDVYLGVSMGTVVNAYKDMFMPFLQMATAATDPEGKNLKSLMKLLGELSALDFSVKIDKTGLSLVLLLMPEKDSDLEKVMGDAKNADKSQLAMLPKEKYLFTMGTTGGYSEHNAKFANENWFSQLIKQTGTKGLNEEALKTLDAELVKMAKAGGPMAISISVLPDDSEGMFGVTVVAQPKNPKDYVESIRKIYKTAWSLGDTETKAKTEGKKEAEGPKAKEKESKEEGEQEAGGPEKAVKIKAELNTLKENIVHTPDAETIEGRKVDTLAVKLEGLTDQFNLEKEDLELVQKVTGKEIVIRFGAIDDKHFVVTFGGGKNRFESVCKHLKSPGESLDKEASIKEASGRLPSPRVSEFYVAVDSIVQAVKAVAKTLGEEREFPFTMPTVNAPLAMTGAMVGKVQRIDIVVPMKLVTAVKEVIEKQMGAGTAEFDEEEEGNAADKDEEENEGGKDEENNQDEE